MIYDVIVVGAGVNGSSTAFALSEKKKRVLLLEQFPLPHRRGSSHGHTRIFRCLYVKEIYAKMSLDSVPIWRDMEKHVNEKLLIQNGMLELIDSSDKETIRSRQQILKNLKVPYEVLSSNEINRRFPPFDLSNNCCGIYEQQGGMVMANKCVAAFQTLFKRNGGVLQDNEQVLKVIPGDICIVVTNKGSYKTKSVVITAGPFSKAILDSIGITPPLQVIRTHLCFWKLNDKEEGTVQAGFPSFIHSTSTDVYGLASMEYPGLLKICYHDGTTVSNIDFPDKPPILEPIQKIIRTCMKGVSDEPSIVESCLYTNTPDKDFIIDYHPKHKNIVIGCGFSGTSFKMSPITGRILGRMALGEEPLYDLSQFRLGRFDNVVRSKASL